MTLEQVIERIMELRPTGLERKTIAQFVAALDGRAQCDATGKTVEPVRYPENAEDFLFIPFPFDEAYIWYALAEIDALNNDTASAYQNDAAVFNEKYSAWLRSYRSMHGSPRHEWRGMHQW